MNEDDKIYEIEIKKVGIRSKWEIMHDCIRLEKRYIKLWRKYKAIGTYFSLLRYKP